MFIFFVLVIFISSFFFTPGGFIHIETKHRLLYYLDQRSILAKIFDVNKNEVGGLYLGREFVVIFDIIDAYFIKLSHLLGITHFFAFTHYLSLIVIVAASIYVGRKYFRQKYLIVSYLLATIFLTSPTNYFSNYFYRTSKTMLSMILALFLAIVIKNIFEKKYSRRALVSVFILSSMLSLIDKQGIFFLSWFLFVFFVMFIFLKNRYYLILSAISFINIILGNIYNYYLGPILIKTFAGYWPDFTYQSISLIDTIKQPKIFILGFQFFLDNLSFLWGNLGRFAGGFLLIIFYILFNIALKSYKKINLRLSVLLDFLLLSSILIISILNAFQIWRHVPLLWDDVKRYYYENPIIVIVLFFLNFIFARLLLVHPKIKNLVVLFLLTIIILNILALPSHFQIIKSGHLSAEYASTPKIVNCVKNKNSLPGESYELSPEDRQFCLKLRTELKN